MNRIILFTLFYSLTITINAQDAFKRSSDIIVSVQNQTLENAWAGGVNSPQFSSIDLNYDGLNDILAFDRIGDRKLPFINTGNGYTYAPQYISAFPAIKDWMLLRDFNGDGMQDIFASTTAGVALYKNIGNATVGLQFEYYLIGPRILSDYGSGSEFNLYVSRVDIPAIVDIDNDGDLDILTFALAGTTIEFHRNLSQEIYGHSDSIKYELEDDCWGKFKEDFLTNNVLLEACPERGVIVHETNKHSGSTLAVLDLDGNGLQDILLGDVSFNTVVAAYNHGSEELARMTVKDTLFPNYDVSVEMPIFPGIYHIDVDFDNKLDMLIAPATASGGLNKDNVWLYKNNGTNENPNYNLQQKDFLADGMIEVGDAAIPDLVDLTGDNLLDLVVGSYGVYDGLGNYDAQIAFYKNVGTTSIPAFEWVTNDLANFAGNNVLPAQHPSFADLDNDGDLDMIVGDRDGNIHYYKNEGNSTSPNFQINKPVLDGIDVGNFAAPELVDLDRDGKIDLLIGERVGNINYYRNTGTKENFAFELVTDTLGGISVQDPIFLEGLSDPKVLEINGSYELFVGSSTGYIHRFNAIEGNLSGQFQKQSEDVLQNYDGTKANIAIADINNDGWLDIFRGNLTGGIHYFKGVDPDNIGLFDRSKPNMKVYPNPIQNLFHVSFRGRGDVIVYNVMGVPLYRKSNVREKVSISSKTWQPGVYFVRLEQKRSSSVIKVVK